MARLTGTDIGETLIGTPGRDRIFGLGGDDELRGGAGKDILDGGLGRDYVLGEDGNDVINGGSSGPFYTGEDDDVLDGGNGQDWVTYEDLDATLFLKFDEGRTLYTHKDQLLNIENAIGSKRDAHFWGDNSDNTFVGIGRMTEFFSSAGDDKYLNKGDRATLYYGGDPAGIILNAGKGVALDGFGDEDRFKRIDFIAGSDFDDVMLGSKRADSFNSAAGDDELNGSGGNDNLIAGPGDDELSGGKGNDNLGGGPGNDTINGGAGRDSILLDESQLVDLSAGFASGSGDVDTISSIENISLAGSNIAIGNDAINTFYSANGNSVMTGGAEQITSNS